MLTGDGCWADFRTATSHTAGRPCLFLDRDGVVIEDTGYPHRASDVRLHHEILDAVLAANERGYVVGLVTNQSGIARGLFQWPQFQEVQDVIDGALSDRGAHLDFVLACPHYPEAPPGPYRASHAWRKPEPGMLLGAAEALQLDLKSSIMVGDRSTDMEAALKAGVRHRILLVGEGSSPPRRGADSDPVVLTQGELRSFLIGVALSGAVSSNRDSSKASAAPRSSS